ncbi:MAG: TonB-dependent receptor [Chitinophagaceae bacterium]|nr:MAG: TonB-dependent receptor [Chitinophagaceae bacterium]
MKRLLIKTKWKLVAFLLLFSIPLVTSAQTITIKGKVIGSDNSPIIGATILVKGTDNGIISANDGRFTIEAQRGDTLVVSSIGYTKRGVIIRQGQDYDIMLSPTENSLNAVVVTGYETQKKIDLTGATATISGQDLQNRPITNVSDALQGQMANLNVTTTSAGGAPDATKSINIRGYTGLGVTGSPLVVIDGIPGGDINTINPLDISSITILKDAAAAAIYGSSAPYGVILITTKEGKKDAAPSITYSNNLSFSQPLYLPQTVNSLQYAEIFNQADVNSGQVPIFTDETIQRIKEYMSGKMKQQTIQDPRPGVDDWYGSGLGYYSGAGPYYGNGNNNWYKIFFKPVSFSQTHNLSVSGGGKSSTYYLSLGYMDKQGQLNFTNQYFKRYNVKANVSTDITKWMTFNLRSSLSQASNQTPYTYPDATGGNWMHQIMRKLPMTPLKNPDGNYSDYSNINLLTHGGKDNYTDNLGVLTGEIVIKPLEGWNITANYTTNQESYNSVDFNKTVYSVLPSGAEVPEFQTSPNNAVYKENYKISGYTANIFSSYQKDINYNHFKILGGYIAQYTSYSETNASNTNLYSNDIPSLSLTYNATPTVGDNMKELATEGFFGRFNYNYKEKYLVEVNGRYDATSRFLPGKRWQIDPSISAGYNISKESFWMPFIKYVNSLKIRGSYGSLGDQWADDATQSNYYPFYPSLGITAPGNSNWIFNDGLEAYTTSPGLVSPDLTWATIKTFDIGADASFLNNRLSISYDWYNRMATDFVGPGQALPAVLGTGVPPENNASIKTTGFDLTINWKDKIGNITYNVQGVLSNYKGTVLKYPNPTKIISTWYPGMTMGQIWGYVTQGLFQSTEEVSKAPNQTKIYGGQWTPGDVRYKDINGDGIISPGDNTVTNPGDRKVIGNTTPQYTYGVTIGAQWKDFDVSLFIQGVAKRQAWINSSMFWGLVPNGAPQWQSGIWIQNLNRWTSTTPNGYFPKYYASNENAKNQQVQTRYLQNAAYMRFKNMQIGYTLPQGLIHKIRLQRLRVYLSIDNLATISKMQKTIDPELSIPGAEGDAEIYPLQRTFSCGIDIGL